MMGAGKSTVGKALAERAGREFRDTDSLLQHRFGRTVTDIFRIYGEEAFRAHETSILESLSEGPYVLATGGGIVLREENWAHLKRLGVTLYLHASAEVLIERLERSRRKRPLLENDDWEDRVRALLASRQILYQRSDVSVCVDQLDTEATVEAILARIPEVRR